LQERKNLRGGRGGDLSGHDAAKKGTKEVRKKSLPGWQQIAICESRGKKKFFNIILSLSDEGNEISMGEVLTLQNGKTDYLWHVGKEKKENWKRGRVGS